MSAVKSMQVESMQVESILGMQDMYAGEAQSIYVCHEVDGCYDVPRHHNFALFEQSYPQDSCLAYVRQILQIPRIS